MRMNRITAEILITLIVPMFVFQASASQADPYPNWTRALDWLTGI